MAKALLEKINSAPLKSKQDALHILGIDNNPNPSIADVTKAYNNLVLLVQPNTNLNEKTDTEKALEIISKAKAMAINCNELLTEIEKTTGYVGEEHIGAMTTAPLNSLELNPQAYKTIIEKSVAINNDMLIKNEQINQDNAAVLSQNQLPDKAIPDFSYDLNDIWFEEKKGTLVILQLNDAFKHWMTNLSKNEVKTLNSGHQIFLRFKNILAVNNGVGTPGIHIHKTTNNKFIACNNVQGDLEVPMRQKNLISYLTILQNGFSSNLSVDVSQESKEELEIMPLARPESDSEKALLQVDSLKTIQQNISTVTITNRYEHATNDPKKGRYHFFEVQGNATKFNLPEELQALKGDHLKSKILDDLRTQIEKASNHVDLNILLQKNNAEISVLKDAQGIFSSLFNINSSSTDALNAMIDERIQQIDENNKPKPK